MGDSLSHLDDLLVYVYASISVSLSIVTLVIVG